MLCLEGDKSDPLLQESYAVAFLLDDYYCLRPLTGGRSDLKVDLVMMLREQYVDMYTMGPTDHAWVSGDPPEPSTTLRLPKRTTQAIILLRIKH